MIDTYDKSKARLYSLQQQVKYDLSLAFPGITFKITGQDESGRPSVTAQWQHGPEQSTVRKTIQHHFKDNAIFRTVRVMYNNSATPVTE